MFCDWLFWISQDPLGFDAGDSNLYRYVNNEAIHLTDPSGLLPPVANPEIPFWILPTFPASYWMQVAVDRVNIDSLIRLDRQGLGYVRIVSGIVRNVRISAAYAEIAKVNPGVFIWAGAASQASNTVGRTMQMLRSEMHTLRSNNYDFLATRFEDAAEALGKGICLAPSCH